LGRGTTSQDQEKKKGMNETVFVLSEEKYFEYLDKIEKQEKILKHHILKDSFFHENDEIVALLCEYLSLLDHMKIILEDIEEQHEEKNKFFYLAKDQALKFSVFFEGAVTTKELLTSKNVSLSLH